MRLDRWFKTHYPELSFGHLQKLIRSGQVRVDGGRVKTNTRLEAGQAVRVPPLGQGGSRASCSRPPADRDGREGSPAPAQGDGAKGAPRPQQRAGRAPPTPTSSAP